jgi:hypothetical protein
LKNVAHIFVSGWLVFGSVFAVRYFEHWYQSLAILLYIALLAMASFVAGQTSLDE